MHEDLNSASEAAAGKANPARPDPPCPDPPRRPSALPAGPPPQLRYLQP